MSTDCTCISMKSKSSSSSSSSCSVCRTRQRQYFTRKCSLQVGVADRQQTTDTNSIITSIRLPREAEHCFLSILTCQRGFSKWEWKTLLLRFRPKMPQSRGLCLKIIKLDRRWSPIWINAVQLEPTMFHSPRSIQFNL